MSLTIEAGQRWRDSDREVIVRNIYVFADTGEARITYDYVQPEPWRGDTIISGDQTTTAFVRCHTRVAEQRTEEEK